MSLLTILITCTALMTKMRVSLEKVLGKENEVKLENLENPEGSDGRRRMVNGYVKDPTIHSKRRDGIDNDAYDYAELRVVPKEAYVQKNSKEDDEDGDGYQVYTGPVSAKTEKRTEDIYVNHKVTTKNYTHNEMSQQKLSDHQTTQKSQETRVSSGKLNYYENVKSEDNYYVNQSKVKTCENYENVNIKKNNMEQMAIVSSNNMTVNTVNEVKAVHTSTINVVHAENISFHTITVVNFTNVTAEKSAKESDKKNNTL